MHAPMDQAGRVVIPKVPRDRLGLTPGSVVDVSVHGDGLHLAPSGRTARLERHHGAVVAVSDTLISDDDVVNLADSIRR